MKKVMTLLLVFVMLLCLAACGDAEMEIEDESILARDLIVLYTNDVHCGVEDNLGYQSLAVLKNVLKQTSPHVLTVDIGDSVAGDVIGTLSKGEAIIDIMNEVGYDISAVGNHEFDYGMEQFLSLTERANFTYVSCNFTGIDGNPVLEPYVIREFDGVQYAFVGITTPTCYTSSTPRYFQNENGDYIYGFAQDESGQKLFDCVQTAVNKARAAGAEYVIALGHLGIDATCAPWTSNDVITHTTGIDVFLDGHSHSTVEEEYVKNAAEEPVLLSQTGTKLASIGMLTISPEDGVISTQLVTDEGIDAFIKSTQDAFEEQQNEVVASSSVDLVIYDPIPGEDGSAVRLIRVCETNLGDLCADAYRAITGADVAFINGGGIRADILSGDVTYGKIISVQPYGNMICMVESTGKEILDALEMGAASLPAEFGGFLQVSGLSYEVDMGVPSSVELDENGFFVTVNGERRVKNVTISGTPIDPEATYTVASHNYMLKDGGDGFTMFQDNPVLLDDIVMDNLALITYITDNLGGVVGDGYEDPYGDGRIRIIEAD